RVALAAGRGALIRAGERQLGVADDRGDLVGTPVRPDEPVSGAHVLHERRAAPGHRGVAVGDADRARAIPCHREGPFVQSREDCPRARWRQEYSIAKRANPRSNYGWATLRPARVPAAVDAVRQFMP